MPFFERDGIQFHYTDTGEGVPFVYQHGLGGNVSQPAEVYQPEPGFRFISIDCRGHGETRPLGNVEKLSFDSFADDVMALIDHLGLSKFVIGGISMGSGISLNIILRYPDRVMGLLLSRPAWLDKPMPDNLRPIATAGRLIREYGARKGLELFKQSEDYWYVLRVSPNAAESLLGQFEQPRAEETAIKLERISNDAPNRDRATWRHIRVPTLVFANHIDAIHPFEIAKTLTESIPGAELRELTSKSVNKAQHIAEAKAYTSAFLRQYFRR
ncbi:MAG: alpha/beta hydrolase [Anaerolineae bacterium]|nr:alpha/beta hydrolase [Anaerolineae bacterium]